jgi:hypothetical protein
LILTELNSSVNLTLYHEVLANLDEEYGDWLQQRHLDNTTIIEWHSRAKLTPEEMLANLNQWLLEAKLSQIDAEVAEVGVSSKRSR